MATNEWQTPPEFLNLVREFYGGDIELDPASNPVAQQTVKALDYYSYEEGRDGLLLPWNGRKVYCNPPYSRDLIVPFVEKALSEVNNGAELVMLVNSATDTLWYHTLIAHSSVLLMWRGRLKFWKIYNGTAHSTWELAENGRGKIGNSPRYLNSVFYFGPNVTRFKEVFGKYGSLVVAV